MNFKNLMLVSLLFVGCGEVDKDALKAMNGYAKKVVVEKDITKEVAIKKVSKALLPKVEVVVPKKPEKLKYTFENEFKTEKNVLTKEPIKDIVKVVETEPKKELSVSEKFAIALKEIKSKESIAFKKSEDALSLAKLEGIQKQLLKTKELEISKTKNEAKVTVANLELKKTKESEKTNQLKDKFTYQKTLLKDKNTFVISEKRLELYKIMAGVVGFLLFLLLLIYYFTRRKTEANRVKIHEDKLAHKMQLKMIEQQGKNLNKMLEVVTTQGISKDVEKEILEAIKESQQKNLIFNTPKKGLIFRR
jgi:alpha-glucosidase (family GH31 glycosyl hydrolase)